MSNTISTLTVILEFNTAHAYWVVAAHVYWVVAAHAYY